MPRLRTLVTLAAMIWTLAPHRVGALQLAPVVTSGLARPLCAGHAGAGDRGSANDPPNSAQNVNVLVGKILRIDVDAPGVAYASPPTNPFFGATPGRDEIFAYGLRNPWRFSFDRLTHQQWVGDVGQ